MNRRSQNPNSKALNACCSLSKTTIIPSTSMKIENFNAQLADTGIAGSNQNCHEGQTIDNYIMF
jgi:hypothetical protein